LNKDGQLEITTKDSIDLVKLAGASYSFYLYLTVEVGENSQQLGLNFYGFTTNQEERTNISTENWSEVLELEIGDFLFYTNL